MASRQVDLNKANIEELMTIRGIDMDQAQRIIAYRKTYGPFHDWDDVARVPGIERAVVGQARETATIGDDEDMAEQQEAEASDEEEMAALLAVAQLDLEAAAAYEVVAEQIDDPELQEMLLRFRADHRRHVDDLSRLASERGISVEIQAPGDSSVLVALASTLGSLDPMAAIEALIGNEQLTNATYDTALWVTTDEEALDLLQRNREDERRHIEWLIMYATEHDEEDEDE